MSADANSRHAIVSADSGLRIRFCAGAESAIGNVVEIITAVLVAVEIVILFAGVVFRYLLHTPLTWSDELASILFLWVAMLGAVIAYRRFEHMRMGALVALGGPGWQLRADALALVGGLAFLALVIHPAIEYALDEIVIATPALEISNAWRAAALPIGLGLMIVIGLLKITRMARPMMAIPPLLAIITIGFLLYLVQPWLMAIGNYRLLVFFVGLVGVAVLAGIPIAFAFGCATFAYLALTTRAPLTIVISRMDEGMSHLILLAVPLFVFLGILIEITGMARTMVGFLANLMGHVRGGLQYVLLGAMYLVSGISGSKAADMAAVAPVLFPEMKERGAKPGELVALLAATGAQTETIPPSLVLITLGSVTGVSIAALFTGGLLPGVVLAICLGVVVWLRCRHEDLSKVRRASGRQIAWSLLIALPALLLPFVIRAAVVEGVATATEVSTIGIAYSLFYGALAALLFGERIAWSRMWTALIDTACLSGAILFIIGTATAMAWSLTQSGFSRELATAMSALPGGAITFMAVSIVVFVILGSVLEGIPAIVLLGPLLFPTAKLVGIHEVHYAMVVILAMGIGLFAPPFGIGYYAACAIGRVDPTEGMGPIWRYMLALLVGLVIVAAVPWISIGFL
jgi:tripartite ATP-independent transporter DctM subunit